MFEWACDRVKSEFRDATWQTFWLTAVEAKPVPEVAAQLGMTAGAVYVAKSRVLAAMKAEVARLVGEEDEEVSRPTSAAHRRFSSSSL